jgi:pimeloyl-ACP methyl ester carboxylesterase
MTFVWCDDGVGVYVEEFGQGEAIVFVHEFGGEAASLNGQITAFTPDYRCVRYCARGFLPSEVPDAESAYGQERSTNDLFNVVDALGLGRFHLVGLSMGSFTSLMASLGCPDRVITLTLAGCSSGPCGDAQRRDYRADLKTEIALLEGLGGDGAVKWFANDSAYRRMPQKKPDEWRYYCDRLRAQSVDGAIRTLRTLHWNRICLWDMQAELRVLQVPTLLIYGDEDHPLIRPTNELLSELIPNVRCIVFPASGHLVNIEEIERFNRALATHFNSSRGK